MVFLFHPQEAALGESGCRQKNTGHARPTLTSSVQTARIRRRPKTLGLTRREHCRARVLSQNHSFSSLLAHVLPPSLSFVLDCRKYYIVVLRTPARRRRRRNNKTRDAILYVGGRQNYFWPLMPETMSSTRRMSDAASIAVLTVCTLTA